MASDQLRETRLGDGGLGSATYDRSRRYRYRLSRVWDPSLPRCCFVMLNPSTATATAPDNTVSRCVEFARSWDFGALEVVNIFAYRCTAPRGLYQHPDPVGAGNDGAILAAAVAADVVIAAWGVHGELGQRGRIVRRLLADADLELHGLGLTKAGHPSHPLYLPSSSRPVRWKLP